MSLMTSMVALSCIVLCVCMPAGLAFAAAPGAGDAVRVLDAADAPDNWAGVGLKATVSTDRVEGGGSLLLTGSGHLRIRPAAMKGVDVGRYDRLVMNVKIPRGHVTEFGVVTRGFPQAGSIPYPRWGEYDESTPAGVWLEYSCNLRLCEWGGGDEKFLDGASPTLSLVYTPGKDNDGILVDNLRLVQDPVRIVADWLVPVRPMVRIRDGKTLRYQKEIELRNVSGRPVTIAARFSKDSLKRFRGAVEPADSTVAPGGAALLRVNVEVPDGLAPLERELQVVEIVPDGDERLVQRVEMLTAAPFPKVKHPFTGAGGGAPPDAEALLNRWPTDRLPAQPAIWMSQSSLNTNGECVNGHAGQVPDGFDRLKCGTCGAVQERTALCGGVFHRVLVGHLNDLARAYHATRDARFAQKARELLLTYADQYHKYELAQPVSQASSYLAPNNATYVLGTVMMTPISRAADLVWDSGALSDADKRKIIDGLFWPAALEMMKIQPGMTNMQDAMNEAIFNMGLLADDPNLTAVALFGSHGLEAKINSVFDADGATPESVSAGYHNAALGPVLAQVQSIRNAGLNVEMAFDRLEKARHLMNYMRMPDGRVPNRGDSAFPGGTPDAELETYGSMSFQHYGMTVLREGQGRDAIYVAIDHRPPAVTHSHFDKLGIILYGLGHDFAADEGSLYNNDNSQQSQLPNWNQRAAWQSHSLVHNTITVDQTSQNFGGGRLLYFHGAKGDYQAVAASTDNVYADVVLERNILLLDGVVAMVDRCLSARDHTYDWTHHSFGELSGPPGLKPQPKLGDKPPYDLPENVRAARLNGAAEFTWKRASASMRLTLLPDGNRPTEYATAVGWANEAWRMARQEAPFVLARRTGKDVTFVSVFEPHRGSAAATDILLVPVTLDGKAAQPEQAIGLKLVKGGKTSYYLFSFAEGEKALGPIKTRERLFAAAAK